jgi:hypothetical protein
LELSQTVSTPPKLGVELGGALLQNELEGSSTTPLQTQLLELNLGVGAVPNRPVHNEKCHELSSDTTDSTSTRKFK